MEVVCSKVEVVSFRNDLDLNIPTWFLFIFLKFDQLKNRDRTSTFVWFKMSSPLENKSQHETVDSPSSLQSHMPHTMPRRNSLRLLTTTPNIPVPPSLRTSPYLTSSSIFSHGLASPTLPSEEDEKWLQDTIPLPSRHHLQVAGASGSAGQSPQSEDVDGERSDVSRRAVALGQRGGAVMQTKAPQHHHRRHISACENSSSRVRGLGMTVPNPQTSNFVPPSMALTLDSSWTNLGWRSECAAGLCTRRWSTGPLRPPNPDKTFTMSGN
jgi:hypothetical protein